MEEGMEEWKEGRGSATMPDTYSPSHCTES